MHRYWLKQPILSASVGVDKMLLYYSCILTTCARKHNEASQDSYLANSYCCFGKIFIFGYGELNAVLY